MIAALYVDPKGVYSGRPDVECWGLPERDAREYAGPWPVVAHPPCKTWGRYRTGDDGGCFSAALDSIYRWRGVIEHPADSRAWAAFGLNRPVPGIWVRASAFAWTCCVEQGNYGHRARKRTWLLAAVDELPYMVFGPSEAKIKPREGRDPIRERRIGAVQRMGHKERSATPVHFAELLLSMARSAQLRPVA